MNRQICGLFLLVSAVSCSGIDRKAFGPVDRASRAVQEAVDGKAGLPQYRELLATYGRLVSQARQSAQSGADRFVLSEYEAALKNLTDLQLVREAQEAKGSDMLPVSEELPGRIAREYALGINTNDPPSIYANEAMAAIWNAAQQHLRAARLAAGFQS